MPVPPSGRRNPLGRRRKRAPERAAAIDPDCLDDVEFRLARLCRETSRPDLTWREWHAQRALCTLATGTDRDHPCPERCRDGCPYLAALRCGFLADDPAPWWRAWRDAADGPQPAISAAKRSNR